MLVRDCSGGKKRKVFLGAQRGADECEQKLDESWIPMLGQQAFHISACFYSSSSLSSVTLLTTYAPIKYSSCRMCTEIWLTCTPQAGMGGLDLLQELHSRLLLMVHSSVSLKFATSWVTYVESHNHNFLCEIWILTDFFFGQIWSKLEKDWYYLGPKVIYIPNRHICDTRMFILQSCTAVFVSIWPTGIVLKRIDGNRCSAPDVCSALFTCEIGRCVNVPALIIAWVYNTNLGTSLTLLPRIGTFPSIDPDVPVR